MSNPKQARALGAGLNILLMIAIMATGNYTFFNVLTLALTFSLLDARGGGREGEGGREGRGEGAAAPALHQNAAANEDPSAHDARSANKEMKTQLRGAIHPEHPSVSR